MRELTGKRSYERGGGRMSDTIRRQAAIDAFNCNVAVTGKTNAEIISKTFESIIDRIKALPSAQPETCKGCKHLGKWENEVEYGYPSPCTCCKRRVKDNYER